VSSEERFDDLARGLASDTIPRGRALRLMGGVSLGGALASVPGAGLAAAPCPTGVRCRGECCPTGVTSCVGTGQNKRCPPCPTGTTQCNGECVDLQGTDPNNCGQCGFVCPTELPTIPRPFCCGGRCTHKLDQSNCGECGKVCPDGTFCCGSLRQLTSGRFVANGLCCPEGQQCAGGLPGEGPLRCEPIGAGAPQRNRIRLVELSDTGGPPLLAGGGALALGLGALLRAVLRRTM
jgi:Stigma-specific protein, Stig1